MISILGGSFVSSVILFIVLSTSVGLWLQASLTNFQWRARFVSLVFLVVSLILVDVFSITDTRFIVIVVLAAYYNAAKGI